MPTKKFVEWYEEDWSFYAGVSDRLFDEDPEPFDSPTPTYCVDKERLTQEQLHYLHAVYLKGYEAGQALKELPTEKLRQMLRDRTRSYLSYGTQEQLDEVINSWRREPSYWPEGMSEEQVERNYLLEMMSERQTVFMDEIDLTLDLYPNYYSMVTESDEAYEEESNEECREDETLR